MGKVETIGRMRMVEVLVRCWGVEWSSGMNVGGRETGDPESWVLVLSNF